MQRVVRLVGVLAAFVFLLGSLRLGQLERGGPPHTEVVLDGGIPATLYLPGSEPVFVAFGEPPPPAERPPALVLVHGYSGDRRQLSGLARRIASAGTAVLTLDIAGHGQNRNPFPGSLARGDAFFRELSSAVDFLRAWPFVDGERIAVGGHSMGAGASLDYATRDSGIDAVVLISGGWRLEGPYRPANALFLLAEDDPEPLRARVEQIAGQLLGGAAPEDGSRFGSHSRYDAARLRVIPGANHASIIWDEETAGEIIRWLDAAWERPPGAAGVPSDPRVSLVLLLALAFLLVLPGLGLAVGRLVPPGHERPASGRLLGLGLLAGVLLLTLPLLSTGPPLDVLPVDIGDAVVAHFALAGLGLLVLLRLWRPELLAGTAPRPLASAAGAGVGLAAVAALLQPFATVVHSIALTPERLAVFVVATLGFLPLAFATNVLLRRGPTAGATLAALGGRAVLFVVLITGIATGALPYVAYLMLGPLVAVSLQMELLATSLYAFSRNLLVIAIVDAGWLALVTATIVPLRA